MKKCSLLIIAAAALFGLSSLSASIVIYDGSSTTVNSATNSTAVAAPGDGNPAGSLLFTTTAAFGGASFASMTHTVALKDITWTQSVAGALTFDYKIPVGGANDLFKAELWAIWPNQTSPFRITANTATAQLNADGEWHTHTIPTTWRTGSTGWDAALANETYMATPRRVWLYVQGADPGFSNGILIDNVTVVPEPSTYALLLGALAVGLVALRRRRK